VSTSFKCAKVLDYFHLKSPRPMWKSCRQPISSEVEMSDPLPHTRTHRLQRLGLSHSLSLHFTASSYPSL